jgi:hypothetical protein
MRLKSGGSPGLAGGSGIWSESFWRLVIEGPGEKFEEGAAP